MLLLAELPVAAGAETRDELLLSAGQGGGQCQRCDLSPFTTRMKGMTRRTGEVLF